MSPSVRHPVRRCALYTRKSSDEGLDQAFNSLDAQREACAAYVKSQAGEGWRLRPDLYDDGGYSGATMQRPGLQRLFADIAQGKVDVVVVYKIDRLTRALADFARMVEIFDRHAVSFVSVTQAFNTTNSMGRLTLNVLLSFAQFEREVTGERIRDKIAASKVKGMWMGGIPPLGYDLPVADSRSLVVNECEAATVRSIFATYHDLGSVHVLQHWLEDSSIRSKAWVTRGGKPLGGLPFSRGALFHMLRNKVYLGMIVHGKNIHPGLHRAILAPELFAAVQARLDANGRDKVAGPVGIAHAPLTGKIFDAEDQPMSPTFSCGHLGKRYRYYVSASLQQGQKRKTGDLAIRRVPAVALEALLSDLINRALPNRASDPLGQLERVELGAGKLIVTLVAADGSEIESRLREDERILRDERRPDRLCLSLPFALRRRGGRSEIVGASAHAAKTDMVLVKSLRAAHAMTALDTIGLPRIEVAPITPYRRRIVRLAFLAPDLQEAILMGRQPRGLTLARLMEDALPLAWAEQRQRFGAIPPN